MKYQILNFRLSEQHILQQHLNTMAENGWQLHSLSTFLLTFKQTDSLSYYKVTWKEEASRKSSQIAQTAAFHVYQTSSRLDNTLADIPKEHLRREQKHVRWRYCWLPLLILFCGWTLCYGYPDIFLFLLSYNIMLILLAFAIVCIAISFFINFRTHTTSLKYDKEIKHIHHRTISIVLLGVILLFLCICAAVIIGKSHPNGTFFVVILAGLYVLDQAMEYHFAKQSPNIPLLIFALLLYIALKAIVHFAPPFATSPQYQQGIFSSDVTLTSTTKGKSREYASWLLRRQSFEIYHDSDYFQYELYDTKAAFITKLAMRSCTDAREMLPIFDYHGVTVYLPKHEELALPGQEKVKWQPYLILRKDNRIIAIKSYDDFTTKRIERMIDELGW